MILTERLKTSKRTDIQQAVDIVSLSLPITLTSLEKNTLARNFVALGIINRRLKEELQIKQQESDTDPLTGLKNRRWFDNELHRQIQHAHRYATPLTLLFIDIDDFKRVNTQYGHSVGDEVLKKVAEVAKHAREDEPVVRLGGDEFVQLFSRQLADEDLASIQHRYGQTMRLLTRQVLEQKEAYGGEYQTDDITECSLSMGVAEYIPGEEENVFCSRANEAMHEAKKRGKNQLVKAEYVAVHVDGSQD